MESEVWVVKIQKEKTVSRRKAILRTLLFGFIFLFSVSTITVCTWYATSFNLEFKELLYTLASPLKGTGQSTFQPRKHQKKDHWKNYDGLGVSGSVFLEHRAGYQKKQKKRFSET